MITNLRNVNTRMINSDEFWVKHVIINWKFGKKRYKIKKIIIKPKV